MSVFKQQTKSHLDQPMFFGDPVDIQRYDKVKYKNFEAMTERMLSMFWRPQEIDLSKDAGDFKKLTDAEKRIFTLNLKRPIILDSVQGRAPTAAFSPITSLPELESLFQTWTFFENIHSRSYTHIIRNVYPNPSQVFDEIMDDPAVTSCAEEITKYYDNFMLYMNGPDEYEKKMRLYLAMIACNALEGVRFYAVFACMWAFAETKRMEGTAKIIKLICRDENLHLGASTAILKQLPKDDPDYARIRDETIPQAQAIFKATMDDEMTWADHLFSDGSMIGLNASLLKSFIKFRTNKCLKALGYEFEPVSHTNPLPWTEKWIGAGNVQAAPQETQITSYLVGGIKQDLREMNMDDLEL